jgi:hypothetical protein
MKFYTLILSILTLLLVSLQTNAQDSTHYKNGVLLEIGGNGLAYSVNTNVLLAKT